jgi:hypothetical protein
MRYQLKRLSEQNLDQAREMAEKYRDLNEPEERKHLSRHLGVAPRTSLLSRHSASL